VRDRLNSLTELIIAAAIEVHRSLGPGLLESAYDSCLTFALLQRDLRVERQKPMPLVFQGTVLSKAYRVDLLVEELVIVEVKAVERLERVHSAQLLSYLRLSGCVVGLLFNFNVQCLTLGGLKRIVNNFPE
jgi:GxxExxY protein